MSKTPEVGDLLDICVKKIATELNRADINSRELESCVSMLIQMDKNSRDIKSKFIKDVSKMPDDVLDAELRKIAAERDEE